MAKSTVCLICGDTKAPHLISRHRNDVFGEAYGFCKTCLKEVVDIGNQDSVVDMLRLMNIPYITSVWENALEKGGANAFSKYLQLIATQKKFKSFMDSDFGDEDVPDDEDVTEDIEEFSVTSEIISRWGASKSNDEYIELEYALGSLRKIKEPATVLEMKRYVQNVKLGKALDNAMDAGDVKSIPQLRTAYTKDLEELGLNVDMSGQEEGRSLGMRIKEWEMNAPIPDSSEFDDIDKISNYVNKWFKIPMKRVFGMASDDEINQLYE